MSGTPFRPTPDDLERIDREIAAIPAIREIFRANEPQLAVTDRVAHQYQIAGSKVLLRIADQLPAHFTGVGLFEPGAQHIGIGRVSTGLGCPHRETDPDFLGLATVFQTRRGERVDFLAINDPTAPSDTHVQFMTLLTAAAQAAGTQAPFGSGLGQLDLPDLLATNLRVVHHLVRDMGPLLGLRIAGHVIAQTARTATSSTAYQTYWGGIVEVGGTLGKFMFAPASEENALRALHPGERHISAEWRARRERGAIEFTLLWLPYIDEQATSTTALMSAWEERPHPVGRLTFPRHDPADADAGLWAALALELGANPANWVADAANTIAEPSTEFDCARKAAYRLSQAGRNALPDAAYAHVFSGAPIGDTLATELRRRRAAKAAARHVDMAP
jgi:hypothetical protein